MIKGEMSIFLLLFFVIIIIGFSSAEEVVCSDYCVDGVSYSNGTYNNRSELCEYGIETACEYGCNITNYAVCKNPQFIDCPDICDDNIFYEAVEDPALECNYTEIFCNNGCDENGCIILSEEHSQEIPHENTSKDDESNDKNSGDEISNVTVQAPTSTNDQDSGGIVTAEKKEKNSNDFGFNLPNVDVNGFFIQYKTPDKDFSFENKVGFIEKKYYSQGNVEDIKIKEKKVNHFINLLC